MSRGKVNRLASGWLVDKGRFYADPKPEGQRVPKATPLPGRLRHVGVAPPRGRFDHPASYMPLHVEKGGRVYFLVAPNYWAGNAWHIPRLDWPVLYSGPFTNTVTWGFVDGPRVIFPYSAINEDGAIKVIDISEHTGNAGITPYLRLANGEYLLHMAPAEATAWYDGAPINYKDNTFVVNYFALWDIMGRSVRLKVQKYNPSSRTTYMQTVTLVHAADITFSTASFPLVKYGLRPDGTVDPSSEEPLGTIELPVASFGGSFMGVYSDQTEDENFQQPFTAYPGFRYVFVGAYVDQGDYYHMPSGYSFAEFGVLVRWEKIYEQSTGNLTSTVYDYYRVIDEGVDITYPSGYVAEDIGVAHAPFLSFVPLSLTSDGSAFEATITPTTTPMGTGGFPNVYLFPIWGETGFITPSHSPLAFSEAWPYYFSCPPECTLPLSSHPVGKSIAGTRVRRVIARRKGEDTTYYKLIPYNFPSVSSGVYRDGMRYGPGEWYDDAFIVTTFARLSSEMSFSCVLPPFSPHPRSDLRSYVSWAKQESLNPLPPLLDGETINAALGDVPIYTGPLGVIPRPLSGRPGRFMGVDFVADTPFAVAAVRMPSDPDKIWGILIQDDTVRIWLWDGRILNGWSRYPLSSDGTLDIPLVEWFVAPNVAHFYLSEDYDEYQSWGSGQNPRILGLITSHLSGSPPALELSPVMVNNYLLPGWPFDFDMVGFDYTHKALEGSISVDKYSPNLFYAFLSAASTSLILVHVAYVDIERQGAMPGARKRVPVVPIYAVELGSV